MVCCVGKVWASLLFRFMLLPADLVAYWDFNSGAGYTIKDVTNHGHDLIASQAPRWEVVRWLSTCGNGVVEGAGGSPLTCGGHRGAHMHTSADTRRCSIVC